MEQAGLLVRWHEKGEEDGLGHCLHEGAPLRYEGEVGVWFETG